MARQMTEIPSFFARLPSTRLHSENPEILSEYEGLEEFVLRHPPASGSELIEFFGTPLVVDVQLLWMDDETFTANGQNLRVDNDYAHRCSLIYDSMELGIFSRSIQGARGALHWTLNLLESAPSHKYLNLRAEFPVGSQCVETICRLSQSGKVCLSEMTFERDEGMIVFSKGTSVEFYNCAFEDDMDDMVAALNARPEIERKNINFQFKGRNDFPLDLVHFEKMSSSDGQRAPLNSIAFDRVHFPDEAIETLATVNARELFLQRTTMNWEMFVDAWNRAQADFTGPKKLVFSPPSNLSIYSQTFAPFFEELSTNKYLLGLVIRLTFPENFSQPNADHHATVRKFGESLSRNNHLQELVVYCLGEYAWDKDILDGISRNTSIKRLEINERSNVRCTRLQTKRAQAVARMLANNHTVASMPLCTLSFHRKTWHESVAPLLERNTMYDRIREMKVDHSAAGLLAVALGKLSKDGKTSLVWMLLSCNQSILADSLRK
jgi:hypothetical protein